MFIISAVAAKPQVTLQRPSSCKNQNNERPLSLFFFFFPPPVTPVRLFFEASETMLRCFLSDYLTVVYFVGGRRWDEPVRGDGDECMCVFYGTSLTVKCLS